MKKDADNNWATKLELYTGVVALEKQVNEQMQDLKEDLNQIKVVLNKLVQKELERESL
jgi:hypothetical protein|tara:strand:- start:262 stop:435 length:174 start_codon:yes stop_codon:yes gene_type:complete